MKAYKIEVLVIDHENTGIDEIKELLTNARYINPIVMDVKDAEIGEWCDEHPLNKHDTHLKEYNRLFNAKDN